MLTLLLLAVQVFNVAFATNCPGEGWIACDSDDRVCRIKPSITSGFMSVSEAFNSVYVMVPFSREEGEEDPLELDCYTDPAGGHTECCYYSMENEFGDNYKGLIKYDRSGGNYFDFSQYSGPIGLRLNFNVSGGEDPWTYRVVEGTKAECSMGPFPVVTNYDSTTYTCSYGINDDVENSIPPAVSNTTWTNCAVEGQNNKCYNLDPSLAYWVRIGIYNQFYYQLIVAPEGYFYCNTDFFDDNYPSHSPAPGKQLYCDVSDPVFIFGDKLGSWEQIVLCLECSASLYTVQYGIDTTTESTITTTNYWHQTLTESLSAGIEFKGMGASGNTKLTTEESTTVTNTMHDVLQTSTVTTTQLICRQDALWQWRVGATQHTLVSGQDSIAIYSSTYFCGDNKPLCPPGYCVDSACQSCTYDEDNYQQNDLKRPTVPAVTSN